MIGFVQRVREASVTVGGERVGEIGPGIAVLVGAVAGDRPREASRLAERLVGYRIFPDEAGRMNRSVLEVGGGVLLVPQFTLAADTRKGMRPSFAKAADPAVARRLFDDLVAVVRRSEPAGGVACGRFGADMQVALVNDGPVTFWLDVPPPV